MGDTRSHRGAHPEDHRLFGEAELPGLRRAVADLAWLLSRDYAHPSALKLVGDRYRLSVRQRTAVMRCACGDSVRDARLGRQVQPPEMAGQVLWIDGYNVLTTVETALAGGVVIVGRDSVWRDMAAMHGTWRKVEETMPALSLVARTLDDLQVAGCLWLLDSPVSHSAQLKQAIESTDHAGQWNVELSMNPDVPLSRSQEIVATADSVVLDHCGRWFGLATWCIRRHVPGAWIADLGI